MENLRAQVSLERLSMECPICKAEPPCVHLEERTEPVVHFKIPPGAFKSDLQLVNYLQEIMYYAKTSRLPLGSKLYEHLQVFLARNELPFDIDRSVRQEEMPGGALAKERDHGRSSGGPGRVGPSGPSGSGPKVSE